MITLRNHSPRSYTTWLPVTLSVLDIIIVLLYIELTISFLIGRKRTVNFRNPRLWRYNCRLFNNHVKVTGNHVKVTGNHVVYDRGAWFLRVIMSSLLALFFLPSVKKHKQVFFLFRSMYNKTIIRFGFCDIQNNQGLGKGYQPQPSASADNPYLDLGYSGYHKNLIQ